MEIADRVDALSEGSSFLLAKDHKDDFQARTTFRLVNPLKNNMAKVSKQKLSDVNAKIKEKTKLNQWQ